VARGSIVRSAARVRLNKYISESGRCSRREADALIDAGRVTLNGRVAELGMQVGADDEVRVDGELVGAARKLERPVYIALNKPIGITCTTDRRVAGNIVDFVGHDERIFMIGRLDKESMGLILLTNDGDIVNEVLRAAHGHEKEYVVDIAEPIGRDFLKQMGSGVDIGDAVTQPCKVRKLGARRFAIVLTQGLNRQIRRMCEALGQRVTRLERVRIMHIRLGDLPRGKWRDLSSEEIAGLAPPPERRGRWQPGAKPPPRAR
jgi:23S rRNA pseudouridine2604 synthase